MLSMKIMLITQHLFQRGDFGFAIGVHDEGADVASSVTGDSTHFDVTYSATENLAFTFSKIVDSQTVLMSQKQLLLHLTQFHLSNY